MDERDDMTGTWPTTVVPESTWTKSSTDCPHPDRWSSTDDDSTEVEVSTLVAGLVYALQPDLVVETGTAWGQTAVAIGHTLKLSGHGRLVSFEVDGDRVAASRRRCKGLPVTIEEKSSLEGIEEIVSLGYQVGFAWLDSLFDLRFKELDLLVPILTRGAVVGIHDTGGQHPLRRGLRERMGSGWQVLNLPTPRGVALLQNWSW